MSDDIPLGTMSMGSIPNMQDFTQQEEERKLTINQDKGDINLRQNS
jgi:hypothetical protein